MCTFLEDGRLETTNNRAERAIKELVIGRKNWLFSKSEKGAQATGIILSILRTAVEYGLDPRKYLIYLFENIPSLPSLTKPELAASLFTLESGSSKKLSGQLLMEKGSPCIILKYTG